MQRALALAARARGKTDPNPMVGAVVVLGSTVVGEGYHHRAGAPHAEAEALQAAGTRARGATLYVTLEPCTHTGRTPPCTEAIRSAGIRRVVLATSDPNPTARGGARALRAAGIEVASGVCADDAWRLNDAYHVFHEDGRPLVALKVATSLDGRIASSAGEARWITSLIARTEAHRLRARHAAILVGVGTVLADDPLLTVRHVRGPSPIRVVMDSRLRTPDSAKVLGAGAPTIFAVTDAAPARRIEALRSRGHEVLVVPMDATGHADPHAVLWALGRRDIRSVLVEGGKGVYTAFLRAGLVDRIHCFVAPKILGGRALGWTGDVTIDTADAALTLTAARARRLGSDVLVEGYTRAPRAARSRVPARARRP